MRTKIIKKKGYKCTIHFLSAEFVFYILQLTRSKCKDRNDIWFTKPKLIFLHSGTSLVLPPSRFWLLSSLWNSGNNQAWKRTYITRDRREHKSPSRDSFERPSFSKAVKGFLIYGGLLLASEINGLKFEAKHLYGRGGGRWKIYVLSWFDYCRGFFALRINSGKNASTKGGEGGGRRQTEKQEGDDVNEMK